MNALRLCWFCSVLLLSGGTYAAAPYVLDVRTDRAELDAHVAYLEDPSLTLTLDQARAPDRPWADNGSDVFNKSYSDSAWWVHPSSTANNVTL